MKIKIKFLKILLLSLLITHCFLLIAQQPSSKAMKFYQDAERYLNSKEFSKAEDELLKAIKKDNNFIEAYLMLGDVYSYQDMDKKAIEYYSKGLELEPDKYPNTYFMIANLYFNNSEYEDARKFYNKYIQYKNIPDENIEKTELKLKDCDFAIEAMKHPVPYNPQNLGPAINSKYNEYFPCLTVDGKTLLYTRLLTDNPDSPDGKNEDFYISHFINGKWTESENIGKPINTSFNEGAPSLSPDGQILIFTACEMFGNYGDDRNGYGSCDLILLKKGR